MEHKCNTIKQLSSTRPPPSASLTVIQSSLLLPLTFQSCHVIQTNNVCFATRYQISESALVFTLVLFDTSSLFRGCRFRRHGDCWIALPRWTPVTWRKPASIPFPISQKTSLFFCPEERNRVGVPGWVLEGTPRCWIWEWALCNQILGKDERAAAWKILRIIWLAIVKEECRIRWMFALRWTCKTILTKDCRDSHDKKGHFIVAWCLLAMNLHVQEQSTSES